MLRIVGLNAMLFLATLAAAAERPETEVRTSTLRAEFSRGVLQHLTDRKQRVIVQPPTEPRGLGVHTTQGEQFATQGHIEPDHPRCEKPCGLGE